MHADWTVHCFAQHYTLCFPPVSRSPPWITATNPQCWLHWQPDCSSLKWFKMSLIELRCFRKPRKTFMLPHKPLLADLPWESWQTGTTTDKQHLVSLAWRQTSSHGIRFLQSLTELKRQTGAQPKKAAKDIREAGASASVDHIIILKVGPINKY